VRVRRRVRVRERRRLPRRRRARRRRHFLGAGFLYPSALESRESWLARATRFPETRNPSAFPPRANRATSRARIEAREGAREDVRERSERAVATGDGRARRRERAASTRADGCFFARTRCRVRAKWQSRSDGGASSRRRDASWERTLRTRASQKPRASAYDVLDGDVIPFERVDETTFHRDAFIGKGGTRSPVMENLPSPFPRILLAGSGEAAPESRPPRASIRIVAHAFERALTHLTS
jgi:hypothetical protein